MDNNYTYPVIIDYAEKDYINIYFPDFDNAATCVETSENYIEAAQDFLALMIIEYESAKKPVPDCSFKDIPINDNQKIIYVNLWLPYHRSTTRETYTKKTLTIPVWLDLLAKQNNINFSSVLVKGLKKELNIE